jgi:class 3 adenylate cyclase
MGITTQFDIADKTVFPKSSMYESDESEEVITFGKNTQKVCVGIVDVVGSTKIAAKLTDASMAKYYSVFLNTLGSVIRKFEGKIVKNIGDSILYYFPEGSAQSQSVRCLECNLSMIQVHDYLNLKLKSHGLPHLDYRISSDYGTVAIAKTQFANEDIFGQAVNICSKINTMAQPNSLVIGSDFYEVVKHMPCYLFEEIKSYSSGLKHTYPVYAASYDDSKIRCIVSKCIEKTLHQLGSPDFEQVVQRLFERHNCFLLDCYEKPQYLRHTLEELYGNASKAIINNIKTQIEEHSLPKPVREFLFNLKD